MSWSWDDGSHRKVKNVNLTFGDMINSIQVQYDRALQSTLHGSLVRNNAEFTLDSDEYITALTAYGKKFSTQEVITALTFTTNKRTFGPYGNTVGNKISYPEVTGKQIAGFFGTSGNVLNSIDVHYAPVPAGSDSGLQKLDAQGGKGGTAWDDGSDHDGVTKICVRFGGEGIQCVKFDYVKDGQTKQGTLHGEQSRGSTTEFVINHPEEYLVSVEGWYDSVVLGIQFRTNLRTSEFIGYEFDGRGAKFTLQVQDKKIIGFHGFASTYLNSIGAYFVTKSSTNPT